MQESELIFFQHFLFLEVRDFDFVFRSVRVNIIELYLQPNNCGQLNKTKIVESYILAHTSFRYNKIIGN